MVFHWWLSDNKCLQVSRTILSILADFSISVLWIVSTHLISKSSRFFLPIHWWLFEEHQLQLVSPSLSCSTVFFFDFQARSRYLSFFPFYFNFILWSAKREKSKILPVLFFWLVITSSGCLADIIDPFLSQNPRGVYVIHSPG